MFLVFWVFPIEHHRRRSHSSPQPQRGANHLAAYQTRNKITMSAATTKLDYSAGVHKDMGGATADVVTQGE